MNKKGVFVKFTIALQVFILLFATAIIPASAGDVPPSPLILEGSIDLDGAPAPVGTEITVELNDKLVGTTTVTSEGVYGDGPGNKLFITCDPDNYDDVKFYVNGVESQISLENVNPGDIIELTLTATTPASTITTSSGSSGGFGGSGFSSSAGDSTNSADQVTTSESDSETDLKSTTGESSAESEEDVPATEKSSFATIGYISIALIALIGIIATAKYKFGN